MRRIIVTLLSAAILLLHTGCTSQQMAGVSMGSSMGAMLCSTIGGLNGGWRGHDRGLITGMVVGGVVGGLVTSPELQEKAAAKKSASRHEAGRDRYDRQTTRYHDDYEEALAARKQPHAKAKKKDLLYVGVENLKFFDVNSNDALDPMEDAYIEMDLVNRSGKDLYEVTPQVVCQNSDVEISDPVTIDRIPAGKAVRYRILLRGTASQRQDITLFQVGFGSKKRPTTVKAFRLRINAAL